MNKVKILSLLAIFIILGCEDEQKVYSISEVPSVFTKKVLIEEFTGAWCGYCPDGAYRLENLINSNAENIIGVSTSVQRHICRPHLSACPSIHVHTCRSER